MNFFRWTQVQSDIDWSHDKLWQGMTEDRLPQKTSLKLRNTNPRSWPKNEDKSKKYLSQSFDVSAVPITDAVFPRWISILILCRNNSDDLFCLVARWTRRPMSDRNDFAAGPKVPNVSNPTGWKMNLSSRYSYLPCLWWRSRNIRWCSNIYERDVADQGLAIFPRINH